jgi:hypothetical protein
LASPIFLFEAQPKEFLLDGLKKIEQRSHKCVERTTLHLFLSNLPTQNNTKARPPQEEKTAQE